MEEEEDDDVSPAAIKEKNSPKKGKVVYSSNENESPI